jgi:hypothetical protein
MWLVHELLLYLAIAKTIHTGFSSFPLCCGVLREDPKKAPASCFLRIRRSPGAPSSAGTGPTHQPPLSCPRSEGKVGWPRRWTDAPLPRRRRSPSLPLLVHPIPAPPPPPLRLAPPRARSSKRATVAACWERGRVGIGVRGPASLSKEADVPRRRRPRDSWSKISKTSSSPCRRRRSRGEAPTVVPTSLWPWLWPHPPP